MAPVLVGTGSRNGAISDWPEWPDALACSPETRASTVPVTGPRALHSPSETNGPQIGVAVPHRLRARKWRLKEKEKER